MMLVDDVEKTVCRHHVCIWKQCFYAVLEPDNTTAHGCLLGQAL